jgi:BON domain
VKTPTSTLQDLVMAELRWDPSIDAANVGVTAHDGAITLSGHVSNFPEIIAAEKAVKRVRGVVAVANELQVHLPTSWHRDDTDIAEYWLGVSPTRSPSRGDPSRRLSRRDG